MGKEGTAADSQAEPWRPLTWPNLITACRLALLPWFIVSMLDANYVTAAWLLVVIGGTDWIDGYLARHTNSVSKLGKILDPAADRIAIGAALICIIVQQLPPTWFPWLVLIREVLVSVVVLVLAIFGAKRVDVIWVGKAGTLLLYFALTWMIATNADISTRWREIFGTLAWAVGVPGVIASWYAAFAYLPAAKKALARGPEKGDVETAD